MVNQNSEPVQAPLPEAGGDTTPTDNPIIGEIDKLNSQETPDVGAHLPETPTPEPAAPAPEATTTTEAPAPEAPAPEAPPQPTQPTQPQIPQPSPEEYMRMQQQAAQYQQVQETQRLQQEAQRYAQQLESQGYLQDQAQQIAYQYMQSRQAQLNQSKQHTQQQQELQGKQAAAEHFARQYDLAFDDLATLRLSNSPEQMEQVAKKISDDRKIRNELDSLKKAQVPTQQFDNSQGAPEVASNDDGWLDRYNNGDRSANAVAAAKKILGI